MSTPSPTPDLDRAHLPNLAEILSRRTLAPVDLFSFYIYMRDQQRSVDYLDFWLDVSQHMSLCRHYVRELRRSVLIDTPELEKGASGRSSAQLEGRGNYRHSPEFDVGEPSEKHPHQYPDNNRGVSNYLRDTGSKHSPSSSQGSGVHYTGSNHSHSPGRERPSESPGRHRPSNQYSSSPGDTSPGHRMTSSDNSPQHAVARQDIRASAEKILYTYLLPGSEREIILPQGILNAVVDAIENEGRDDPEVFDAAQDYVFQAMERDALRPFLRSKALGNLVPPSLMLRLIIGLLALFGAFWTGFILIFLNYSRATRCWLILPFSVAIYLLASHQYMLDPILGLLSLSEYTFCSFHRIKERFVQKLIRKRCLMELGVIIVVTAALCCIFILVPSTRI